MAKIDYVKIETIKQAIKIPSLHLWDDYFDILTEDFKFITPLRVVEGRNNFIEFEKNRSIAVVEKTLFLFSNQDQNIFYHINEIEFPMSEDDTIITQQEFHFENDRLSAIIITGTGIAPDEIRQAHPEISKQILD